MPFITISSGLTVKVPTRGTTGWDEVMRTDAFAVISAHDHTGSGNGAQLTTAAISADAITGAKIRLDNDEYLRWRNAANSADISAIKINTSDELVINATVASAEFQDDGLTIVDNADNAKKLAFDVSAVTTATTRTLTVPDASGTIVLNDNTATLTSKTINLASNTLTGTTAEFNIALSDGSFATLAGTETLTGKTINLASNTLTGTTAEFNTALSDDSFATLTNSVTLTNKTIDLASNTLTGTTAEFNTALSDDSFATLTGTETLTNKTLTSPDINNADIDGGTASNTQRIVLPKDTTTNLDALTDVEALIAYDTTQQTPVFNTGTGWTAIGAGSGSGSLDTIWSEDFDTTVASDWSTGDNATFLTSPTSGLAGTTGTTSLTDTTTPLSGGTGFKYTQAAGSADDYIASPAQTIGEKEQGNYVGFTFWSKYDGANGDIHAVIYDATNSVVLEEQDIVASSSAVKHTVTAFIPDGVTSVRVGFHVKVENAGAILLADDFELTSDPIVLQNSPKFIFDTNILSANVTSDGTMADLTFSNLEIGRTYQVLGTIVLEVNNGGANSSVNVTAVHNSATINRTELLEGGSDNTLVSLPVNFAFTAEATSLTFSAGSAAAGSFVVGDGTLSKTYIQLGYIRDLKEVVSYTTKNTEDDSVRFYDVNGYGSTNNKIRRFSNISINGSSFSAISSTQDSTSGSITISDSAASGTEFTINETAIYYISYSDIFNANNQPFGLSLNSSQLTTSIESITNADRLAISFSGSLNQAKSLTWSGLLEKGDVVRAHTNGTASGTPVKYGIFSIAKVGNGQLFGVPKDLVGYLSDQKTSGTAGGTSTSNTVHTRTLNTSASDFSKFGSLSSNQFTLESGIYEIEAYAPAYSSARHQAFLYDVDNTSYVIDGTSSYSNSTNPSATESRVAGQITITTPTTYEIRHWFQTGLATNGLGIAADNDPSNPQSNEVYTFVKITKKV